jgi:hypothetical protein
LRLLAPAGALVGAHVLWRHSYYGEWLPNTYYAKNVRDWGNMTSITEEEARKLFAPPGKETESDAS